MNPRNARPIPRYPYERRQRLHRATVLRHRMRIRQASLVAGSLLTLSLSLVVVLLITHFTNRTPAAPLFVVDDGSVQQAADQAASQIHTIQAPSSAPTLPMPVSSPALTLPHPAQLPGAGAATKMFGQRAVRPVRTLRMLVTAYCPGPCCCGSHADGITASGKSVFTNAGHLVAADTRILPFNSLLSIPGYDRQSVVPVLDRGGKIKGHRLDLLFPTHDQAKKWGARWLDVTVYEYVN